MSEDFDKDKVLARVRKMLALSSNEAASDGERDNALRMAHATLAKYNLTIGDTDVVAEPRVEGQANISPHPWARALIEAIAQLYFCRTLYFLYRDKRQIHHFIGRQSNVVTAIEMAQYIVRSINREARRKAAEYPHIRGYERAFCKGAASIIWWRCKAIREEAEAQDAGKQPKPAAEAANAADRSSVGTALVLASLYQTEREKNEQAMAEWHPQLKKAKDRQRGANADAYRSGQTFGSKLSLHRQVADR